MEGGENMSNTNCCFKSSCIFFGIIVSILVGVVGAFLTFSAVITATPAFLWVLFGIAVVYLLVLPAALAIIRGTGTRICICSVLPALLTGIIGTIIASLVLLGITFAATSILGAIITGALLAFFALIIAATSCLVKCVADCPRVE